MAEVKDREEMAPKAAAAQETETASVPAPETESAPARVPLKEKWKSMPRKKRRRIVRLLILLLVLAVIGGILYKIFGGKKEGESQILTDMVQYGSITSVVDGSGLTRAKSSETITLTTTGTVLDVLVAEGDIITAGTPLFTIDSPAAETAVQKARSNLEGYQKQLSQAEKDIAGLALSAGYPGKLLETVTLNPGDTITKGQKVAVLADDTRLRLTQYYSYAYAGQLTAGQTVDVSVPALMSTIPGRIEAVHMVSRITSEGSKLFSAEIILENEGALTAEMAASATVNVNGETVYPYEPGKLEYYRTGDLTSTVSGTVLSSGLVDYLQVSAGQVLVTIDGEESESELFTIQQNVETAQEELEAAEKNLANCTATAPIDGMVIGLSIQPGDEIAANTTLVTISDTSTITVSANVDERNISYIKPGMMVDLDQWGTPAFGTVETVSMSSTVNNGVATYPITISADNSEGSIQVNSYINYSLTASENDNCLILPLQCVRTVSTEEGETLQVVYVAGSKPDNAVENIMADEMIPEGYWAVPVEIGISDNYNVEIRSGVEEGTEVFTQMQSMYGMGGMGIMYG
nr:HlyD family efflux transporter periplasmic adaptor subunit [uncultured Oscillibacter sp.]